MDAETHKPLVQRAALPRLMKAVNGAVKIAVIAGIALMVVLISAQIGARFILPKFGITASYPWTEELARYLMIWVIFLAGALAARDGLLIAVQALVNVMPPRWARMSAVVSLGLLLVFFVVMAWVGWQWSTFGADEISPAMKMSKFWLYVSLPIGFLLSALNTLPLLVAACRS